MLRSTNLSILLFFLLNGLLIAPLFAKGHRGKHKGDRHMHKLMEVLELDEEQKKKVEELKTTNKDEMKKARETQKKAQEAFHTAMSDATKSDDDLKKLHDEMATAKTAVMQVRFNQMLQLRALLNDEQKKKFAEHHKGKSMRKKRGKK